MRIDFYHITQQSLLEVVPILLRKTREAGKRARMVMPRPLISDISEALWSRPPEGWLPHGVAGRDDEDALLCPIWLVADEEVEDAEAGAYPYQFYLNGVRPSELVLAKPEVERLCILFKEEAHVGMAREFWRAWRDADHELHYWQQNASGGWAEASN